MPETLDRNADGREGLQHDGWLADVERSVIAIFSASPLETQPRYVAEVGCGDGALLQYVYETIRDKTLRGKQLANFPLTLIGADIDRAALDATARTLAGIDHVVIEADVGEPERFIESLHAHGISGADVLHIRAFVDHERPYGPPADARALDARSRVGHTGVYVDGNEAAIPAAAAVQSLVEHFERWSKLVTPHGLLLVERHRVAPFVQGNQSGQSESSHPDGPNGSASPLLVEADVALMAAAEVGLFTDRSQLRSYPPLGSYARVTLNLFKKRGYRVRLARESDAPELEALEAASWPPRLQIGRAEIARRICAYPAGQCVVEIDDAIVGAVYSQRLASIEPLRRCTFAEVDALHYATGEVVQLLGVSVHPEKQQLGLGDQLIDLMLLRSNLQAGVRHVAAITRCRDFRGRSVQELAEYIERKDSDGCFVDPILAFHQSHGARFEGLVQGFRPEDTSNFGAGVLVHYDLKAPLLQASERSRAAASAPQDLAAQLERCARTLLGPARSAAFAWDRPLRDLGLDSLDLLKFRSVLQREFGCAVESTFFFSHPRLADIRDFLRGASDARSAEPLPDALHGARRERLVERVRAAPPSPNAIAIIGMAARFPGADSLDEYWSLLRQGRDAIGTVPAERWNVDDYCSDDPERPGKIATRYGGFLRNVDEFDAGFFGIAAREAQLMDPQQRLLIESHWEALEHAGIDPNRVRETRCGIFVGLYLHDYELLQAASGDDDVGAYHATGNAGSIAAGRIAYFLGARGPALTLDTACSSSLVAVHQAMRSLRSGESDLALASGVNLILSPRLSVAFSSAGMLAPDGRCKTFDAAANGYVRSEGCGTIVLKRLEDALHDGDEVLAVLRGSAVNQDGASNGLTAPSLPAQTALLRDALRDAALAPADIHYVEAHGTGTSLGDPVEFQALRNVFGADPERRSPLWLGSVKTNIGHTEAAAGVAGVVKVVLAMRHGQLPAHLHFRQPNPHIDLESLPARVPTQTRDWSADGAPLRAGVSSFGFSGTNAHVIVEEAPRQPVAAAASALQILPVSAKTPAALRALAVRYAEWLPSQVQIPVANICAAAGAGRAHHSQRLVVAGRTHGELANGLRAAAARAVSAASPAGQPKIGFLFTGQGAQYVSMARDLAMSDPVFRDALAECGEILAADGGPSLEAVIYPAAGASSVLDDTANTQPALFSIEYALARMLQSFGVEPVAVMGHSVGEYAAACIAGVFSLRDGLKLISARGRLMGSLPKDGAMAAVLAPVDAVRRALAEASNRVEVGAYNGPANTVLSGRRDAVLALGELLERRGMKVVPLQVSHAFHSHLMEPIVPVFREIARWVKLAAPRIALVSNVTGAPASDEVLTPDYWARHIREPVRFEQGIRSMLALGVDVMLEVGPHPVLSTMGRACSEDQHVEWLHTLERGRPDWDGVSAAVAKLYERGTDIDWRAVVGAGRPRCQLPTYAWQRKRYWFVERDGAGATTAKARAAQTPDLVFEPVWVARSVLDQVNPLRMSGLPPPHELVDAATAARRAARARYPHTGIVAALDVFCCQRIVAAFGELGWAPAVGEQVTPRALIERFGVLPRYERFLARALAILAEDGWLARAGNAFVVAKPPLLGAMSIDGLATLDPSCSAELNLLQRTTHNLARILRGEIDVLELIFPGGSLSDAVAVYTRSPFATVGNDMVVATMQRIVSSMPAGRTLRILEIGAGTGGTTAALLPLLKPAATEYVFTDVSSAFLDAARTAFKGYPFLRYEIYNAELDLGAQGFAPGGFDLVIAANVLHATVDLRASVARAADLLSPGGSLLLVEGLGPTRWIDLVFGLTEGWWRFEDAALRPDYPLLDPARWRALLHDIGLSSAEVIETAAAAGEAVDSAADLFMQGVVTARKPGESAKQPSAPRLPSAGARNWVVLADDREVAVRLAKRFEQDAERCVVVAAAEIPAGGSERLHARIVALKQGGNDAPVTIVDCSSMSAPKAPASGAELLATATELGMRAVDVVRAAARAEAQSLWLVTRGARVVHAGDAVSYAASTLSGFANVARAEYPKVDIRSLDVDGDDAEAADAIYRAVRSATTATRVAFRGGQRFVMSLAPTPRRAALRCSSEGSYLIVGGMGDLGLHTAAWLAERGAKRLVLAGRTPFPPRNEWPGLMSDRVFADKIALVRRIEAAGVELSFPGLDICDPRQIAALVDDVRARGWGPIRGAVQAAAVISDRLIADVDAASYSHVLAPKIAGTWQLVEALRDEPLEFLASYSSIGAVVGLPGQASYGAANAFLDVLSATLRTRGIPALSINWCGWDDTGLTRTAGGRRAIEELALLGINSVSSRQAPALLDQAFSSGTSQAVVIPLNLELRDASKTGGLDPLIARLLRRYQNERAAERRAAVVSSVKGESTANAKPASALDGLTGEALTRKLEALVRATVAELVGVDPANVDLERSLGDMGMDSLRGLEFRKVMQAQCAIVLPATLVWNYPTARAIVTHIAERVAGGQDRAAHATATPAPKRAVAATLDVFRMSDEEALRQLVGGGEQR
jgi:acyl transferase domain-containing protein/acyl carrier protein